MIELTCGFCSKQFTGKKSQRTNRFCTKVCRDEWLKTPMNNGSKSWFKHGHKTNVGLVRSDETKSLLRRNHNPLSNKSGESAGNWRGGRQISLGYVLVYAPEHPNNSKGYVREHRLVMEDKIGRYLKRCEQVHHIDGNKQNNSIDNLMLFENAAAHTKHHHLLWDKVNKK